MRRPPWPGTWDWAGWWSSTTTTRSPSDGGTDLALSDDAAARFRSYGWHTTELGEAAEDLDALEAGLRQAIAGRRIVRRWWLSDR